ncbi:MAG: pilus assembly PilX N-terminal domain-containing protein [Gemmatimonadales bacterium]
MDPLVRNERGIALALAIFAIVIVGALVGGAFFAGTQEQRVAENVRRLQQSFGVAEVGVGREIATWDPVARNGVARYPDSSIAVSKRGSGSGVYGGEILKLNGNMYLLDITGQDSASRSGQVRGGGARQRIGLLARIQPLQIDIQASLTTQGGANLAGNAAVDGHDHTPPGWVDCDPVDSSKAGIRVNGPVTTSGNAAIDGDPRIQQDETLSESTFTKYGDVTYDQLALRANLTIPAGTIKTYPVLRADGSCDRTAMHNWGDGLNPAGACARYFPIIHATGNLTLNGVQGQGILLVDGNLDVQGSYEFFGIVIVRGALQTAGGGATDAHFWGAVMAQNVDLDLQNLRGTATLNYSKCAIIQSLQGSQPPAPMVSRGWAQLF